MDNLNSIYKEPSMANPIQEATELTKDLFRSIEMILSKQSIFCSPKEQFIAIGIYKIYKNKDDLDFTVVNVCTFDNEQTSHSSLYDCVSYIACEIVKEFCETRHQLNLTALARSMQKG